VFTRAEWLTDYDAARERAKITSLESRRRSRDHCVLDEKSLAETAGACRHLGDNTAMTSRQIELESKIAMLEHSVDTLSHELAVHQRSIEQLQQDLASLVLHLKKSRDTDPIEPHDSPPPHWGKG